MGEPDIEALIKIMSARVYYWQFLFAAILCAKNMETKLQVMVM